LGNARRQQVLDERLNLSNVFSGTPQLEAENKVLHGRDIKIYAYANIEVDDKYCDFSATGGKTSNYAAWAPQWFRLS
jgi:hypothetical protein